MVKRRNLIFAALISMFLMVGCTNTQSTAKDIIKKAELKEDENSIINAITDNYFVFEFETSKDYEKVILKFVKYEFGELSDEYLESSTYDISGKGQIVLSTNDIYDEDDNKRFLYNVAVINENSTSRYSGYEDKLDTVATMFSVNEESSSITEGEVPLAAIACTSGHGMQSLSSDFFSDVAGNIDEIKDYDIVYILICEFVE